MSTQSSILFAVNPSLGMLKGFAWGCCLQVYNWATQLSALSSYASIWVWHINLFA